MQVESSWNTGLGKIATRSAQTVANTKLDGRDYFRSSSAKINCHTSNLAIILASALSPLVTLMERIRINRAGGSFIRFQLHCLIAGIGYFIVHSIKSQWATNASSVQAGIEQASKWLHSGELPIPTEKIDELLNAGTKYLLPLHFGQSALQFSGGLASLLAGYS